MPTLMDVLLSDNPNIEDDRPQAPWKWERKGVEIPCKGLFLDEMREVRKAATRVGFNKTTHAREELFDSDLWGDMLIIKCTGDVFTNADVRARYGGPTQEATVALKSVMRHPKDYSGLLAHCLDLCGVDAEGEKTERTEDTVKN